MLTYIIDTYKIHRILLLGDFNAYIGQLNQLYEEMFILPLIFETRQSLHSSTNARGIKLVEVMEKLGFYTLNGRVKEDIPGKF